MLKINDEKVSSEERQREFGDKIRIGAVAILIQDAASWKDARTKLNAIHGHIDPVELIVRLERVVSDCNGQGLWEYASTLQDAVALLGLFKKRADRWHQVAIDAGAITHADGTHLFPLPQRAIKYRATLEWYASPANWFTRNADGNGHHQMGDGTMEQVNGKPGRYRSGQFFPDTRRTARIAIAGEVEE